MPSKEEPLVFYESVPRLTELSSFEVALEIWYTFISRDALHSYTWIPTDTDFLMIKCLDTDDFNKLYEQVGLLRMPQHLEKLTNHSLYRIHFQMAEYIGSLNSRFFAGKLHQYRLVDWNKRVGPNNVLNLNPRWWVWRGNREIDHEKTALNLLSAPELTEVQKFVIRCQHRVVDDMTTIPISSLPQKFIEEVSFEKNPLVFYWICHLKNELSKIPVGNSTSIDVLVAKKCLNDGFSWFEYFWDRLGIDSLVPVAKNALGAWHDTQFQDGEWVSQPVPSCRLQKRLLSKMSVSQQNLLLSEIPDHIMFNFLLGDEPEWAFNVWMLVKDQMVVDSFGRLIYRILNTRIRFERDMELLVDIWNTADDHLKSNVSQWDEFIMAVFNYYYRRYSISEKNPSRLPAPSCYRFLYLFLSAKSVKFRGKWMKLAVDFLAHDLGDFLLAFDVLKLHSPDDEKLSTFKNSVLKLSSIRIYSENLVNQLQFGKLSIMLTIYSPNEKATRKFVEELLQSKEIKKAEFMLCLAKWIKLSEFIDKIYENDCDDSLSSSIIKNQFIESFVTKSCDLLLKDQNLEKFNEVVEPMCTSEKLLVLKQNTVECFKKRIVSIKFWRSFEENNFYKFVSWCLNDETEVDNFKNSLPIDDIFNKFLNVISKIESSTHDDQFDVLNKCLVWYFGSSSEAKKYKVRKMYDFDNASVSEIFRKVSKNVWRKCLKKLFDEDSEEVRKFRLEYVKQKSEKKKDAQSST